MCFGGEGCRYVHVHAWERLAAFLQNVCIAPGFKRGQECALHPVQCGATQFAQGGAAEAVVCCTRKVSWPHTCLCVRLLGSIMYACVTCVLCAVSALGRVGSLFVCRWLSLLGVFACPLIGINA